MLSILLKVSRSCRVNHWCSPAVLNVEVFHYKSIQLRAFAVDVNALFYVRVGTVTITDFPLHCETLIPRAGTVRTKARHG